MFESARLHLYVLGGVLVAMGVSSVGVAWYLGTERALLGVGATPGFIGLLLVLRTCFASTLDELDASDV
jgi:hypothetical protein